MITLNPSIVTTLTGVVLPILLALLVNASWKDKYKVIVTMICNAVAALLSNALNDTGHAVLSLDMLTAFVQQLVISVAMYLGVYKKLDINTRFPNAINVKSWEV